MPDKQTTDAWTMMDVIGKQNKRLFLLAMAMLIAWMTTIGVFVWYLHEYDFESYSYTQDGEGNNVIGDANEVTDYGADADSAQANP